MMKILLMGSGGNFSLFTQSAVVLIEKPGLQEMIGKDKMKPDKAANNFSLVIFEIIKYRCFAGKRAIPSQNNEYCFPDGLTLQTILGH
jgi:hypothetical protein